MVHRFIESPEFSLGVWRMKAECMVASVEGGKQEVREQLATKKFNPDEASEIME